MSWNWREFAGRQIRRLADRIDPEGQLALSSSRFYFVRGVGLVTKTDDGVQVKPRPRGCRLYYIRREYDNAYRNGTELYEDDKA